MARRVAAHQQAKLLGAVAIVVGLTVTWCAARSQAGRPDRRHRGARPGGRRPGRRL